MLTGFKWTQNKIANCRCPICGDSKKNKTKTRFYFYPLKGKYLIRCHNCSASMTFQYFLKTTYPAQYKEFLKELLIEKGGNRTPANDRTTLSAYRVDMKSFTNSDNSTTKIVGETIDQLPSNHPAKKYCIRRKIPKSCFPNIYYTQNYRDFIIKNQPIGVTLDIKLPIDKRIVFPLLDEDRNIVGFQGRAMALRANLRYVTVKYYENEPKLFGREKLNKNTAILVTEGPIDSLFLPNAIALCGGDISSTLNDYSQENITIVLDNEPRNKHTVKKMETAIDLGFRIVVWKGIKSEYKDINDMILNAGMTQKNILAHIKKHTYSGIKALIELGYWKKTIG